MKGYFFILFCSLLVSAPVLAQETVYPVPDKSDLPTLFTADHLAFVVEKTFEHKLTIGFPTDARVAFLPSTKARVVILWIRVENLSQHAISVDVSRFTTTDDQGRTVPQLTLDQTFDRFSPGAANSQALVNKTLRSISLGRAGNKETEEQLKDDLMRYALLSGDIPPRGVKEGLIYFDAPPRKKFTLSVRLGDLWSRPFVFSNAKPK
jgi:hypothetical protein